MSRNLLFLLLRQIRVNHMQKCSFGILEKQEQSPLQIRGFAIFLPAFESTVKTVIFAKVNLSKLVEMLKIGRCCKYVSNLNQTITFT